MNVDKAIADFGKALDNLDDVAKHLLNAADPEGTKKDLGYYQNALAECKRMSSLKGTSPTSFVAAISKSLREKPEFLALLDVSYESDCNVNFMTSDFMKKQNEDVAVMLPDGFYKPYLRNKISDQIDRHTGNLTWTMKMVPASNIEEWIAFNSAHRLLSFAEKIISMRYAFPNRDTITTYIKEAIDAIRANDFEREAFHAILRGSKGEIIGTTGSGQYNCHMHTTIESLKDKLVGKIFERIAECIANKVANKISDYMLGKLKSTLKLDIEKLRYLVPKDTFQTIIVFYVQGALVTSFLVVGAGIFGLSLLEAGLLTVAGLATGAAVVAAATAATAVAYTVFFPVDINSEDWRKKVAMDTFLIFKGKKENLKEKVCEKATSEIHKMFRESANSFKKSYKEICAVGENLKMANRVHTVETFSRERQILEMDVESLKEKYSTTHFLIHRKHEHDGKKVIIGYDTSIPMNKIIRVEDVKTKVIRKNPYNVSNEAAYINNSHLSAKRLKPDNGKLDILHECIKQNAENLWRAHSNLTIITGDTIRSVNEAPIPEACIVLYCLSKGYIPIDEEPFPRYLSCGTGKIKTDVREGYFSLGPTHLKGDLNAYNDPICMGSNIGGCMRNASGSLGLFINLPNNEKGFITCCHVLFDCIERKFFSYEKQSTEVAQHVIQPGNSSFCGSTDTKCGEIKQAMFSPNVSPVSIDAAIVKVISRMPSTGHFVIQDVPQVTDLGYTENALPVFDTGKVRRQIDRADLEKPLLKSGTKSGLTRSLFRLRGAQVRIFDDGAWLGFKDLEPIVMKGQYEVESGSIHNTFFNKGDSGSAVFMKDPDGKLACIGIAIGKTSYETTVVTPIGAVLDCFGLKDSDVTKFP